jgi:hypothetical protein
MTRLTLTRRPRAGASSGSSRRGHDGRALAGQAYQTWKTLGAALRAQVRAHPYESLFMATGVGYVLAGGLLAPSAARALRASLRLVAVPILAAIGQALAEQALVAADLVAERDQSGP